MDSLEEPLYILGCGGHARSVAEVALYNDKNIKIVFVDDNARENETIFGFPVINELPPQAKNIFAAVGDNTLRKKISGKHQLITIVSKSAVIGINAMFGKGVFVGHKAYIGPEAVIGNGTIVNTGAIVEHETKIGEFCHIAPNAVVCGRTVIGDNIFIGAGSTVVDSVNICANCCVGAGSVVIASLHEQGTYAGTPVHLISTKQK